MSMSKVGKVITVDGPAASGKTSVSRELAHRLGWKWVSTGAFYRGLAFAAQELSISSQDTEGLLKLALSNEWKVLLDDDRTRVLFRNKDVTKEISAEKVGVLASQVSQIPEIRRELLDAQRNCAHHVNGLVAEGRDCGTVVFPAAEFKVYLTADSDARAQRRADEQGQSAAAIKASQSQRDHRDSTRTVAPLHAAQDAYIVDTSHLTLAQVVDVIVNKAKEKGL